MLRHINGQLDGMNMTHAFRDDNVRFYILLVVPIVVLVFQYSRSARLSYPPTYFWGVH